MKIIAHVNAAVIMTQPQALDSAAGKSAELFFDSLTNRFQRFEAGGLFDYVNADALSCAVIGGGEDGHRTSVTVKVPVVSLPHI